MAFTVEDGTGLAAANAYVSVADFKAYHDDRLNDYSAFTDPQIEDAIVKGTDYMDRRYRNRFIGRRKEVDRSTTATTPAQRLEWPRIAAVHPSGALMNEDVVPIEVEEACYEYSFRALTITLAPDPTVNAANVPVTGERVKVGPIETETQFAEGGVPFEFRTYPEADAILRGIVLPKGRAFR